MALNTNRHLDEDEIERYSLGGISEEDSASIEEHLLLCEACRGEIEKHDHYLSAMQSAGTKLREEPPRKAWSWSFFPPPIPVLSAVGLVILIALASLWFGNRSTIAPVYAVNLVSTRGSGIETTAPPRRNLRLSLELAGLPQPAELRVEIVNRTGTRMADARVHPDDAKASVFVPGLRPDIYFVRAYAPSGELLREYGLEIRD